MDTAFRKEVKKLIGSDSSWEKYYVAGFYTSPEVIKQRVMDLYDSKNRSKFFYDWDNYAINCFYNDLKAMVGDRIGCKVYIENTAHTDVNEYKQPGSVLSNISLIEGKEDLLGICWDTEHAFASGDPILFSDDFIFDSSFHEVKDNLLVHLNTVQPGVARFSGKDHHSLTTVFECGSFPHTYYEKLAESLNNLNIPYIREVKSTKMNEELAIYGRNK